MKIAATGFVSEQAGSVASANALLLRELLEQGHQIDFYSKSTFVDPRHAVPTQPGFGFIDVTNTWPDRIRRAVQKIPGLSVVFSQLDAWTYGRALVRTISSHHSQKGYDACLWLGEFARGRVPGLPSVSFVQGAPGADARSVLDREAEIRRLAGLPLFLRWKLLAMLRLSRLGLPPFEHSDHWIVGSSVSRQLMNSLYQIPNGQISVLPYPIDLETFKPLGCATSSASAASTTLRVLWLGRIVPRKRLALLLDGAARAIEREIDLRLTIVGRVGFIQGYEKLIQAFRYPGRLEWEPAVSRDEVSRLMSSHDVLVQPSDEENFGSSVAEAQACGLPVIVGASNGNRDYLCSRDIHLKDDRTETFTNALSEMAARKAEKRAGSPTESRDLARVNFDVKTIAAQLAEILQKLKAAPVSRTLTKTELNTSHRVVTDRGDVSNVGKDAADSPQSRLMEARCFTVESVCALA